MVLGRACKALQRARTSSNTSGFFLCGMMLEPVVKAVGNSTNAKSWLLYSTRS